jgi:hypothetical protein
VSAEYLADLMVQTVDEAQAEREEKQVKARAMASRIRGRSNRGSKRKEEICV